LGVTGDKGVSMVRKGRYVYRCPDCGGESWSLASGGTVTGSIVEPSKFDGKVYPSCRRLIRLCYWCLMVRWGDKESVCMGFPTQPVAANGQQSSESSALVAGPFKQFSELWDFLTTTQMPTGESRVTGRLSLSFESGFLKVSLTDDQTRSYCSLQGRNLDDLLAEIDLRLGDGSLPWRVSNYTPKGRRGK